MLAAVEVPFRVIDTAAGDLGASAARKFDCEGWCRRRAGIGSYLDVQLHTFQARPA